MTSIPESTASSFVLYTNFESPDFGIVRSTFSTPRQMQFALRLEF
ncbi:MAG: hypothetical protein ACRD44_00130 [Bryobacteraceae bacterium]